MSRNLPDRNSPGRELAIQDARDLAPATFRRLVASRYRRRVDSDLAPVESEEERKRLEASIESLEKVDQTPDFLPARYLTDGTRRSMAVCRISTPSGKGTGFLVGKGVLLTNNHVLPSREEAAGSVAEFNLEDGKTPSVVKCLPDELYVTDRDLDFTLVACDTTGIADIPPIPLSRDPASITRRERAAIIQHPAGRKKEVALHNSEVTRVKDKVIHYRTDTEPGSSGSPVFNDRWELVALHHAGWIEADGRATNEGIRIPPIVARLEQLGVQSGSREKLESVLTEVQGASSFLGFFDTAGLPVDDREVVVDTFTGTREFADVGYWNIEHFNNSVDSGRVQRVADVVERLLMDAIGLVEVESGALDKLVFELGERGLSYDYKSIDVAGSQDLAILYDRETTTVRLRPDLLARFDNTSQLRAKTAAGKSAFPRRPLFAEVEVQSTTPNESVKFLMLVVHLKAMGDAQSRARRKLSAKILEEIVVALRDDEGLPVILGGDFNDLITSSSLAAIKDSPDLFSMTLDDQTGGDPGAITYVGGSFRSLIDHIVVSGDVEPGPIFGDDVAIVRVDRLISDFSDKVSDHVPVVFRMVFRETPIEIRGDVVSESPSRSPKPSSKPSAGKRRRDYGD
jgi:endonuclease/exonuclease/phosphatase family metal-dependent hydrolase